MEKLTEEETRLLTDGLDLLRDEAVSANKVKLFLGQPVAEIEKIDALVARLRGAR